MARVARAEADQYYQAVVGAGARLDVLAVHQRGGVGDRLVLGLVEATYNHHHSPARFTVTLGARRHEISGCPSHVPGCHGQQRERGQGGQ